MAASLCPDIDACLDRCACARALYNASAAALPYECGPGPGLVPYLSLHYCHLSGGRAPLGVALFLAWAALLAYALGAVATRCACPAAALLSRAMRLSQHSAGAVLLGAVDALPALALAASAAARAAPAYALCCALGSACACACAALGLVSVLGRSGSLGRRPTARDAAALLGILGAVVAVAWDGRVLLWEAVLLLAACPLYVCLVLVARLLRLRSAGAAAAAAAASVSAGGAGLFDDLRDSRRRFALFSDGGADDADYERLRASSSSGSGRLYARDDDEERRQSMLLLGADPDAVMRAAEAADSDASGSGSGGGRGGECECEGPGQLWSRLLGEVEWHERGPLGKLQLALLWPLMLARVVTVPPFKRHNRLLLALCCVFSPLLLLLNTGHAADFVSGTRLPVAACVAMGGAALALPVFVLSGNRSRRCKPSALFALSHLGALGRPGVSAPYLCAQALWAYVAGRLYHAAAAAAAAGGGAGGGHQRLGVGCLLWPLALHLLNNGLAVVGGPRPGGPRRGSGCLVVASGAAALSWRGLPSSPTPWAPSPRAAPAHAAALLSRAMRLSQHSAGAVLLGAVDALPALALAASAAARAAPAYALCCALGSACACACAALGLVSVLGRSGSLGRRPTARDAAALLGILGAVVAVAWDGRVLLWEAVLLLAACPLYVCLVLVARLLRLRSAGAAAAAAAASVSAGGAGLFDDLRDSRRRFALFSDGGADDADYERLRASSSSGSGRLYARDDDEERRQSMLLLGADPDAVMRAAEAADSDASGSGSGGGRGGECECEGPGQLWSRLLGEVEWHERGPLGKLQLALLWPLMLARVVTASQAGACIMSSAWVLLIACEFVSALRALGRIAGLNERVLALTAVAWGVSSADLVSDTSVAYKGLHSMGVGGALGSAVLTLSVGLGAGFCVRAVLHGGAPVVACMLTPEVEVALAAAASGVLLFVVATSVGGVYLKQWAGFALLLLYTLFVLLVFLLGFGVVSLPSPCQ
eukprot:m51a1_g8531 putative sodium potassium calcium exchanger mitochondrial (997) ;mRNA; f:150670-156365